MASPSRASGPTTARTTRVVGREATTRSRGSTSRLTRSQLAKLAREECEKLMGAVSSIYSPAELEGSKQKEVLEFEPDRLPEGDPQRPDPPDATAPLEDFQQVRLLDGLGGVLNSGRGKIDKWLENLKTRDRREHLEEIDEWFNQFQDRGPELASFFQKCETEVEQVGIWIGHCHPAALLALQLQGRVLCQRSENLVNKLAQDAVHTRQEVTEFVDHKLKPMAGGGQGGMVHAIEKKRLLAQIHQDHARLAQEDIEEKIQEVDLAIEQAKKDFYDHRLSRMRMQQAEKDDITDLQNDIEKRPN
eukprot:symbB.v1.2.015048.t2/scaffold1112.1/size147309/6